MIYKGKQVEVVTTGGLFTQVRYAGDEEHKTFNVLTADLKQHKALVARAPRRGGLGPKMEAVVALMSDGLFRTLDEISALSGYESLTGLSAGIRSLRKPENGGYTIDKQKRSEVNEYEYALTSGRVQI